MFKKSLLFIALLASGSAAFATTEAPKASSKTIEMPAPRWKKAGKWLYKNRGKALIAALVGLMLWDGFNEVMGQENENPVKINFLKKCIKQPICASMSMICAGVRKLRNFNQNTEDDTCRDPESNRYGINPKD